MTPTRIEHPLVVIEEEARAVAKCFGVAASDDAAAALVDRVIARLGGAMVYFPLRQRGQRTQKQRDRDDLVALIRARFNGANSAEIAREFKLTTRHVRRLLKQ